MKVLVISSKYPPEYSGSGLRAHNTYLRLLEKYAVKNSYLSDAVMNVVDPKKKSVVVGQNGKNAEKARLLVKRYFEINTLQIISN